jgi:hypothetical protein
MFIFWAFFGTFGTLTAPKRSKTTQTSLLGPFWAHLGTFLHFSPFLPFFANFGCFFYLIREFLKGKGGYLIFIWKGRGPPLILTYDPLCPYNWLPPPLSHYVTLLTVLLMAACTVQVRKGTSARKGRWWSKRVMDCNESNWAFGCDDDARLRGVQGPFETPNNSDRPKTI